MAGPDAELLQRLVDHPRLHRGRRILHALARAPAVAGTIDQNHPMMAGEPLAERLRIASRFELAPWSSTTGGPAASRRPMSTTFSAAPATSIDLPCAG